MKYARIILGAYLLLPVLSFAQGTSCSSPYTLTLDGVCRNYAVSSTTGTAGYCTDATYYSGTGRITIFSFTSNGSASCVLINITTSSPSQAAEVLLYSGCSGGGGLQSQQLESSMCFNTGNGIWAPWEAYSMLANHTYYLRVWTPNAGTITLCAQNYDPPNNLCSGATAIGPTPIIDNNACHKPGTGVTPAQLCAVSLENTAFYTYTVQSTGVSAINITNISCNNGNNNSENYMQIGFFTGNCGALTWVNCTTTSGANVTANTSSLPAGTKVYVAIDGYAGSNCQYSISASNSEPLAASIKYFSAWKAPTSNILKWVSLQELDNDHYEVQRSLDGKDFVTVGTVAGERASYSEKTYQIEDRNPPVKCYYRLKQVDINGREKYYKVITVIRSEMPYIDLSFPNPVTNNLLLNLQTNFIGEADIQIISMNGQPVLKQRIKFTKGDNSFYRNLSSLATGKYVIVVETELLKVSKTLIKSDFTPFKFK